MPVEIVQLLVSPAHRYEGRPADGPTPAPPGELVEQAQVRAGLGLVGDRYFAARAHRDAAVTFVSAEAVASLPGPPDLSTLRRNVLLRGLEAELGVDVDALVGRVLVVDSGSGPLRFRVNRAANPCRWLDVVIGEGSWRALRGRGGIRTTPLGDGVLRVGPVDVAVERSLHCAHWTVSADPLESDSAGFLRSAVTTAAPAGAVPSLTRVAACG